MLQCILDKKSCTNFINEVVIFLYILFVCFNQLFITFSPSFLHELLLNNVNDIHGKPKQLVDILTARLPKCVRVCSRDLCVYLGGLSSTITFHWSYT